MTQWSLKASESLWQVGGHGLYHALQQHTQHVEATHQDQSFHQSRHGRSIDAIDILVASELDKIVLLLAKHTDNLQSDTSVFSNIVATCLMSHVIFNNLTKRKKLMQVCSVLGCCSVDIAKRDV